MLIHFTELGLLCQSNEYYISILYFIVAGFGFGVISGAFSLVNVLADMVGPGTIGIHGHSSMFFITSGTSPCLTGGKVIGEI